MEDTLLLGCNGRICTSGERHGSGGGVFDDHSFDFQVAPYHYTEEDDYSKTNNTATSAFNPSLLPSLHTPSLPILGLEPSAMSSSESKQQYHQDQLQHGRFTSSPSFFASNAAIPLARVPAFTFQNRDDAQQRQRQQHFRQPLYNDNRKNVGQTGFFEMRDRDDININTQRAYEEADPSPPVTLVADGSADAPLDSRTAKHQHHLSSHLLLQGKPSLLKDTINRPAAAGSSSAFSLFIHTDTPPITASSILFSPAGLPPRHSKPQVRLTDPRMSHGDYFTQIHSVPSLPTHSVTNTSARPPSMSLRASPLPAVIQPQDTILSGSDWSRDAVLAEDFIGNMTESLAAGSKAAEEPSFQTASNDTSQMHDRNIGTFSGSIVNNVAAIGASDNSRTQLNGPFSLDVTAGLAHPWGDDHTGGVFALDSSLKDSAGPVLTLCMPPEGDLSTGSLTTSGTDTFSFQKNISQAYGSGTVTDPGHSASRRVSLSSSRASPSTLSSPSFDDFTFSPTGSPTCSTDSHASSYKHMAATLHDPVLKPTSLTQEDYRRAGGSVPGNGNGHTYAGPYCTDNDQQAFYQSPVYISNNGYDRRGSSQSVVENCHPQQMQQRFLPGAFDFDYRQSQHDLAISQCGRQQQQQQPRTYSPYPAAASIPRPHIPRPQIQTSGFYFESQPPSSQLSSGGSQLASYSPIMMSFSPMINSSNDFRASPVLPNTSTSPAPTRSNFYTATAPMGMHVPTRTPSPLKPNTSFSSSSLALYSLDSSLDSQKEDSLADSSSETIRMRSSPQPPVLYPAKIKALGTLPADEAFSTSLDELEDLPIDTKPPYLWWTLIRAAILGAPERKLQMETLTHQISQKYP